MDVRWAGGDSSQWSSPRLNLPPVHSIQVPPEGATPSAPGSVVLCVPFFFFVLVAVFRRVTGRSGERLLTCFLKQPLPGLATRQPYPLPMTKHVKVAWIRKAMSEPWSMIWSRWPLITRCWRHGDLLDSLVNDFWVCLCLLPGQLWYHAVNSIYVSRAKMKIKLGKV